MHTIVSYAVLLTSRWDLLAAAAAEAACCCSTSWRACSCCSCQRRRAANSSIVAHKAWISECMLLSACKGHSHNVSKAHGNRSRQAIAHLQPCMQRTQHD